MQRCITYALGQSMSAKSLTTCRSGEARRAMLEDHPWWLFVTALAVNQTVLRPHAQRLGMRYQRVEKRRESH